MLRVKDILSGLLEWAPASLAWERDNIGLLVGSADDGVERVLVCLDVTPAVVAEAVERGATCIVAHHPVIFHPLKTLRTDRYPGSMYAALLRAGISVIAMHTNADAARNGLNSVLADMFALRNMHRLDAARGQRLLLSAQAAETPDGMQKLQALLEEEDDARLLTYAAQGEEIVLQLDLPSWRTADVRARLTELFGASLRSQVTRQEDALSAHGIGVVGDLEDALSAEEFLAQVKRRLSCEMLRCSPFSPGKSITRVAVSSGAGSSYVSAAIAAGADVLVTGDLTHHTFLDFQQDILLVDAGHFETEKHFIRLCAEELMQMVFQDKQKIDILQTRTDTNPVRFV